MAAQTPRGDVRRLVPGRMLFRRAELYPPRGRLIVLTRGNGMYSVATRVDLRPAADRAEKPFSRFDTRTRRLTPRFLTLVSPSC